VHPRSESQHARQRARAEGLLRQRSLCYSIAVSSERKLSIAIRHALENRARAAAEIGRLPSVELLGAAGLSALGPPSPASPPASDAALLSAEWQTTSVAPGRRGRPSPRFQRTSTRKSCSNAQLCSASDAPTFTYAYPGCPWAAAGKPLWPGALSSRSAALHSPTSASRTRPAPAPNSRLPCARPCPHTHGFRPPDSTRAPTPGGWETQCRTPGARAEGDGRLRGRVAHLLRRHPGEDERRGKLHLLRAPGRHACARGVGFAE